MYVITDRLIRQIKRMDMNMHQHYHHANHCKKFQFTHSIVIAIKWNNPAYTVKTYNAPWVLLNPYSF